jgi:hypothetical protein
VRIWRKPAGKFIRYALVRQIRRVATRPRQTRHQSGTKRVATAHKHDWDDRRRSLGRHCRWGCTFKRPARSGNQTVLALLARLFDNLGTVIPYEDLCLLIGHKSANSAATHILRQYTVRVSAFVSSDVCSSPEARLEGRKLPLASVKRLDGGCLLFGCLPSRSAGRTSLIQIAPLKKWIFRKKGLFQQNRPGGDI